MRICDEEIVVVFSGRMHSVTLPLSGNLLHRGQPVPAKRRKAGATRARAKMSAVVGLHPIARGKKLE